MPRTAVVFFAESDGSCPVLQWLDGLPSKVQDKCVVRVERLQQLGHELRRPEADILRDGIHELRVRYGNVNYRLLYFFHKGIAVISHGLKKEATVAERQIELAVARKNSFARNPLLHTYEEAGNG